MKPIEIALTYKHQHTFYISLASKITVLLGDSGTGKTTIVRLLDDYVLRTSNTDVRVFHFNATAGYAEQLALVKDATALLVDEESLTNIELFGYLESFLSEPFYYLLITRKLPLTVPCSYKDVFILSTTADSTRAVRAYADYDTLPKCSTYANEDEGSGHAYFDSFIDTVSMQGNLNWNKYTDKECLILDGACIGAHMPLLLKEDVKLYLPESFEFLLLNYYAGYTHDDAVAGLSPEKETFEQLYDVLTTGNTRALGFAYSKSFTRGRFLLARVIPEFSDAVNKYLIKWFNEDYGFVCADKIHNRDALRLALQAIGLSEYYKPVFDALPNVLDADVKLQIVYSLHDLGIKEFQ